MTNQRLAHLRSVDILPWLVDWSCIRARSEQANHIWSYDFVETARTAGADTACSAY